MNILKVLVIDDEASIRRLLVYNLQLDGHSVIMAANAPDGIKMAIKDQPDLILLDVMLPGMDGLEACTYLKHNPQTREIPVLMISAKTQVQEVQAAMAIGANGYIKKPFDIANLSVQLQEIVGNLTKDKTGSSE